MKNSTFSTKILLFFSVLILFQGTTMAADFSVKFIELDADQLDEIVMVRWVTESEYNSQGYKIQRVIDGGSSWEDIGVVESNGNTPGGGSYEFKDENPLSGTSFYRIKQMDFDGTVTYSPKIGVDVSFFTDSDTEIEVYPNPTDEEVNITSTTSFSELVTVEMMDISGKLIAVDLNINDRAIQLRPLNQLQGLYFIMITDQNRSTVKKIKFGL